MQEILTRSASHAPSSSDLPHLPISLRYGREGFTLVEMMVVIIIITLMAGITVMMMNVFLRGQGVRQAGNLVSQTITQCKQRAADSRLTHFVTFENHPDGYGVMRIFKDINGNKMLDDKVDVESEHKEVVLPRNVAFKVMPKWIGIEPSGYTIGYSDVPSSTYEAEMRKNHEAGDIILFSKGQTYAYCGDLDPAAGKIRKFTFLTGEPE
ncbi:MAG: prepilin-type N-terminal cleavage/methylation domain-containing protein [Planctomycetes bacterium]|nr:prepilin-type N-terminal cleavage/methylation domain-containing protein [Planctomycetota bacterium]